MPAPFKVHEDPATGLRVWAIREMLAHRGLTHDAVAAEVGVDGEYLKRLLRDGEELDRIEDAVTRISDARGGVPLMCCGLRAYVDMCLYLHPHPTTREEFGRGV